MGTRDCWAGRGGGAAETSTPRREHLPLHTPAPAPAPLGSPQGNSLHGATGDVCSMHPQPPGHPTPPAPSPPHTHSTPPPAAGRRAPLTGWRSSRPERQAFSTWAHVLYLRTAAWPSSELLHFPSAVFSLVRLPLFSGEPLESARTPPASQTRLHLWFVAPSTRQFLPPEPASWEGYGVSAWGPTREELGLVRGAFPQVLIVDEASGLRRKPSHGQSLQSSPP